MILVLLLDLWFVAKVHMTIVVRLYGEYRNPAEPASRQKQNLSRN